MLLSGYASDSDSGSETESGPVPTTSKPGPRPAAPTISSKPSAAASTSGATSTAPSGAKGKKRTGPIKITLDLPKASKGKGKGSDGEDEGAVSGDDGTDGDGVEGNEEREAKRVKLGGKGLKGGAGASSLLGMLPAPKRKLPASSSGKATLGGGGADKKSSLSIGASSAKTSSAASKASSASAGSALGMGLDEAEEDEDAKAGPSSLLPASMARKAIKSGASKKQEEELDLFGLGFSSTTPAPPKPTTSLLPPLSSISSAPAISEFVPPEPTPNDPYPGYYQLPSGQWAAYEPDYYHSFFPDADADTRGGDDDGRRGHMWNDFREREMDMVDVHASAGLAEAREEEERRQMRTKPKLAGDDFVYQAVGATKGVAADRHQLSSLLNSAYTQREALEERIAINKKNNRTGRAKYGF